MGGQDEQALLLAAGGEAAGQVNAGGGGVRWQNGQHGQHMLLCQVRNAGETQVACRGGLAKGGGQFRRAG